MDHRQSLTWRGVAPLHQPAAQAQGKRPFVLVQSRLQSPARLASAHSLLPPVGAAHLLGGSVTTLFALQRPGSERAGGLPS